MLNKYLKYKKKYLCLSGGDDSSSGIPLTLDIINMSGESLYNISFDENIYI